MPCITSTVYTWSPTGSPLPSVVRSIKEFVALGVRVLGSWEVRLCSPAR